MKGMEQRKPREPYCLQLRLGMTPSREAISRVERKNWSGKIYFGDLRIMTRLLPESITNQIRIKCCNPSAKIANIPIASVFLKCQWKLRRNQYNSLWLSLQVIHRRIRQNIIPILSRSVPAKALPWFNICRWIIRGFGHKWMRTEYSLLLIRCCVTHSTNSFSTWARNNGIVNMYVRNEKSLANMPTIISSKKFLKPVDWKNSLVKIASVWKIALRYFWS